MKVTPEHNARIAKMKFSSVYPHYVSKVVKKDRTKAELHQVIEWLTGFDDAKIQQLIDEEVTFETCEGPKGLHAQAIAPLQGENGESTVDTTE